MFDRLTMLFAPSTSSLPDSPGGKLVVALLLAGSLLVGCDLFGGGDSTPPDAPTNLSATSESETVVLEWSAPSNDDLEGYNVYRTSDTSIDVSSATPLNEDSLVPDPSFTDDTPENGTTYRYRVTAVDNSDNESDPSESVRVTPFADPPSRPSD